MENLQAVKCDKSRVLRFTSPASPKPHFDCPKRLITGLFLIHIASISCFYYILGTECSPRDTKLLKTNLCPQEAHGLKHQLNKVGQMLNKY